MIKSIYTMKLDDEYPSVEDMRKFRMIVEFIYEDLASGLYDNVLINNETLKINKYYENKDTNRFTSNNIYYQPMAYNDKIFAFTVDDSMMDIEKFKNIVNKACLFMNIDLVIDIDKFSYRALDMNDESMRRRAIINRLITDKLKNINITKKNNKRLVRRIATAKR